MKLPRFVSGVLRSITARLTVLYALSGLLIISLTSAFLYWGLKQNIRTQNREFLLYKVRVLSETIRMHPNDRDALVEEVVREAGAARDPTYFVRVLDATGRTWMETPGMERVLPGTLFPLPVADTAVNAQSVHLRRHGGEPYLLVSARIPTSSRGEGRQLQLALGIEQEIELIADYARATIGAVVLGVLLSAAAGALVARNGLRPLRRISLRAERVTANRLHERIGEEDWPEELHALATVFDEMLARLQESFTKLSQFNADLAHELRTPLHNLMVGTEVTLSRPRSAEEYREALESNIEEYRRLSRMIESLLFLARAEEPAARIDRVWLDARSELEAVQEFHEAIAADRGVEISCEGTARLYADPILFRRAITNLLSNALRYTPAGGSIVLRAEPLPDNGALVNVTDSGSGIPEQHVPRVFDRLYRVDQARSGNPEGSGLGLALVKSIMDLHQGSATAGTGPGGIGTTIRLVFPAPEHAVTDPAGGAGSDEAHPVAASARNESR